MARDFTKNTSNYMRLGQNTVGAILNGAAHIMVSAWVNLDSWDTAANNNRVLGVYIDGANSGLLLMIHDGTNPVVRCAARSQAADSLQAKNGTTSLSISTWYQIGAIIDIGGDTITPYLNGVAEGGGSVTFGAATWTNGTPTSGGEDSIGCSSVAGAGGAPSNTMIQVDGRICEVGVWTSSTAFATADQAALSAGIAPCLVRTDALKVYFPLLGVDSPERDHWGGLSGTITGTIAASDHQGIIYPSGVISIRQAAAAAGGTVPLFYHQRQMQGMAS